MTVYEKMAWALTIFFFFSFSFFFTAPPGAYGSSQASGQTGTAAASLRHNHSQH